MSDLLFDTPWWILGALVITGITLFIAGNNRMDRTLRNVGVAAAGLAVLLLVTSILIDTDREKCIKNSKALVTSVWAKDWPTLQKLVAPQCKASINGTTGQTYVSGADFIAGCRAAVDQFGLKAARVTSISAEDDGGFYKVNVDVYSEQEATMGYPLFSSWEFDWQKATDGSWQMSELIALKIGQKAGDQIRGDFPKGKV